MDDQETDHDIRPAGTTNRLSPAERESPVNPNWRGDRGSSRARRARGSAGTPGNAAPGTARREPRTVSPVEDFVYWLQFGGWKLIAGVAVLLALVAAVFIISQPVDVQPLPGAAQTAPTLAPIRLTPTQPTITPGSSAVVEPAVPLSPDAPQIGMRMRIVNTGSEGLFLRPEANTAQPPIKTIANDAVVTITGPEVIGDRVWVRIRDETGAEGFVAAEFLQREP